MWRAAPFGSASDRCSSLALDCAIGSIGDGDGDSFVSDQKLDCLSFRSMTLVPRATPPYQLLIVIDEVGSLEGWSRHHTIWRSEATTSSSGSIYLFRMFVLHTGGYRHLAEVPPPSFRRSWTHLCGDLGISNFDWLIICLLKIFIGIVDGCLERLYQLLELPHCRTLFRYTQGRHTSMILADNGHDIVSRARRIAANTPIATTLVLSLTHCRIYINII